MRTLTFLPAASVLHADTAAAFKMKLTEKLDCVRISISNVYTIHVFLLTPLAAKTFNS